MKDEEGMSQTVVVSSTSESTPPSLGHISKELWNNIPTTANLPNSGGQMITLSPPAGDPAGGQQDTGQGSSTAGSDLTGDAEGVWSVDIDQAFQEALAIYPPCGRRKIIISDEGKMYGRNELIARYIKLRCGKTRTRKQVSSHIQVLARKKMRDEQAKKKSDVPSISPTLPSHLPPTSVTPNLKPSNPIPQRVPQFPQIHIPQIPTNGLSFQDTKDLQALLPAAMLWGSQFPLQSSPFQADIKPFVNSPFSSPFAVVPQPKCESPVSKAIASSKLMLNGFTAYMESPTGSRIEMVNIPRHVGDLVKLNMSIISDKYPSLLKKLYEEGPADAFFLAKCWANVQFDISEDNRHSFAVDSYYTSVSRFDISVSTKVCSFGKEAVEKVEIYSAEEEEDHFAFRLESSPMCEYMVKFIKELKKLEDEDEMNKVLDNFTVLQVVTNKETEETLMVLCFVFEVSKDPESTCSVFHLTDS